MAPDRFDLPPTACRRIPPELRHSIPMRIGDIVCLRGESEAKRTCAYLTANGILEDHLWILEKGITGWKFEDMTTTLN